MTDMSETHSNYLLDLGHFVKDMALSARAQKHSATGDDLQFASGRLLGLYEVISLMQQQAIAFGISTEAIGLADIDPDRDLT
jgi:hypothetical protein